MSAERLDRFMARANAAYYAGRDPFADFVTAPELSQVFGELLGLWACVVWQAMGSPARFLLVEAGPGRGTLMADALRAAGRALLAFGEAAELGFIETSPPLIEGLVRKFPSAAIYASIEDVPAGPMILLANEFLDALPIRQFVRRESGWMERFVTDGAFAEHPAEAQIDPALPDDPPGSVRERGDAACRFVGILAERLTRDVGAGLFLDYGPKESAAGESLQAICDGRPADPLADPGSADLTAHVDFAALAAVARAAGTGCFGPEAQGAFLARLGIHERTAQLGRSAAAEDALSLIASTRRLTMPEAMGALFKAFAIASPTLAAPPGFTG
jgi:NADH dehydrogenase [ubiquinone] 1 alpha subcomplex assembly factor 7